MTEELFSTTFAADILLELLEKGPQKKGELREGACDGRRPTKAFGILEDKWLVAIEGRTVRLTAKGEKVAEILEKLEAMMDGEKENPV